MLKKYNLYAILIVFVCFGSLNSSVRKSAEDLISNVEDDLSELNDDLDSLENKVEKLKFLIGSEDFDEHFNNINLGAITRDLNELNRDIGWLKNKKSWYKVRINRGKNKKYTAEEYSEIKQALNDGRAKQDEYLRRFNELKREIQACKDSHEAS